MLPKAMKRHLAEERTREQVKDAAVNLCCAFVMDQKGRNPQPPPAEPTREAWRIFFAEFPRMFSGLFAATWKAAAAELAAAKAENERG